jgi:hypothetical protein
MDLSYLFLAHRREPFLDASQFARTIFFVLPGETLTQMNRWLAVALATNCQTEKVMRQQIRTCAIAFALFGASVAAAQQPPAGSSSPSGAQGHLNLNQTQERAVSQGLRNEQAQPQPPGPQAQVGSKVPDSLTPKAIPDNVTAQVPEAKEFLFVKLPDRILVVDPHSKMVAEIILAADTGGTMGSGPGGGQSPGESSGQR